MNDTASFLRRCSGVAASKTCQLSTTELARLMRAAGREDLATTWDKDYYRVVTCDPFTIRDLVHEAEIRLYTEGK